MKRWAIKPISYQCWYAKWHPIRKLKHNSTKVHTGEFFHVGLVVQQSAVIRVAIVGLCMIVHREGKNKQEWTISKKQGTRKKYHEVEDRIGSGIYNTKYSKQNNKTKTQYNIVHNNKHQSLTGRGVEHSHGLGEGLLPRLEHLHIHLKKEKMVIRLGKKDDGWKHIRQKIICAAQVVITRSSPALYQKSIKHNHTMKYSTWK